MKLLIRADADTEIGTGHVMRCLALAQGWREAAGEAVFAMATDAPSLEKRLAEEGFEVERLAAEPGSTEDAAAAARLAQAVHHRQQGTRWWRNLLLAWKQPNNYQLHYQRQLSSKLGRRWNCLLRT